MNLFTKPFLQATVERTNLKLASIYINNKLLLARKYARIVSEDIICPEKRTVAQERSSRATVRFEEQIMSEDNSVHISEAKSSLSSLLSFEYLLSSPAGGYPRITPLTSGRYRVTCHESTIHARDEIFDGSNIFIFLSCDCNLTTCHRAG